MGPTEVEDIKKRWQDIHRKTTKKGLMTQITTIVWSLTHKPDILQWKVNWALGASLQMKLEEVMEFQLSYFKS